MHDSAPAHLRSRLLYRVLSCHGVIIKDEIYGAFTVLRSASDADVNGHYVGTRLLPITNGRLSLYMVDTHNAEAQGSVHTPVRFASTADGCMAKPMRRGRWELVRHSARVVGRRLPRHNYPRTVYLRPPLNPQLMFQIAINPPPVTDATYQRW